MLRIGQINNPTVANLPRTRSPVSALRLAALSCAAVALGAGMTVVGVSLVQAGDDAGAKEFLMQESARGRASRSAPTSNGNSQFSSYQASAPSFYAPPSRRQTGPLFPVTSSGALLEPAIVLNPFKTRDGSDAKTNKKTVAKIVTVNADDVPGVDTVSGAASTARSICVRLCDGFHAPIGYLRASSDLQAHEALCRANNPGIPVKAFRVAAGATTIDGAVSADGKTYSSLPMAYAYEKSGDQACIPAIVQANERRISLLRDFTLRPGDTIMLEGRARVFNGSSQWPYRTSDFSDFRTSSMLSSNDRRRIDHLVGQSRLEAMRKAERRSQRVREASLGQGVASGQQSAAMSDIAPMELRGSITMERSAMRTIAPLTLGTRSY